MNVAASESVLYKELGALTKNKDDWDAIIPFVASLLTCESVKIRAKALWLLGEMGLAHPNTIQSVVPSIVTFCESSESLLRERALTALGRIGRGRHDLVEPYWTGLFRFSSDPAANVRLAFIWASENMATNTPEVYRDSMSVFSKLLHDTDDRVRMEAPEIFRVLGKRCPEFVLPYVSELRRISETDSNRVVRIHCLGAISATRHAIAIQASRDKPWICPADRRL